MAQSLIIDIVPSCFLSTDMLEHNGGEFEVLVVMLNNHALAYFVMLSVLFAWGIEH